MLSHKIIKVREVITPQPHYSQNRSWTPGIARITCQHDLDVYIESRQLREGDFVCSVHGGLNTLYDVNYIYYIERDFKQLKHTIYNEPLTHFLVSVGNMMSHGGHPFNRWSDVMSYRKITPELLATTNDYIQNSIEGFKGRALAFKEKPPSSFPPELQRRSSEENPTQPTVEGGGTS